MKHVSGCQTFLHTRNVLVIKPEIKFIIKTIASIATAKHTIEMKIMIIGYIKYIVFRR